MKLTFDPNNYLKQQEVFTGEMIARIADHLECSGIKGEELKELTGKISFEIGCMIDNVNDIEFDGDVAYPNLLFTSDSDELIHFGGSSTVHEMVYGILNAMFKENT
ncbi:hypothetical protein [Candidatus Thiodiazotropha sp. CDECU1]|uniref:hypothetical protein n=1 Tax=Candidatus Thiodiazotropha sp. CDECU1 TaxID=3065865 RepID=UPI00292E22B9|nr:hypothetical protein [Candidatus Thiodiazotropha sp. CDECU1]